MNVAFIKHEFSMMLRNKKNVLFLLFMAAILLSYCFVVLPNQETTETFDRQQTLEILDEVAAIQVEREQSGMTGFYNFTGISLYALNNYWSQVHGNMVTAYDDHDFNRFVYLRAHYLEWNRADFLSDKPDYFARSPFPGKDKNHLYYQTMLRYQSYLQSDIPITYAMVEEKTAVQSLQKLLLGSFTYFIIFCGIYFSCDVLVRDRQNQTILQGFPMSWYRVLNAKTVVAFLYTLVVISTFIILGLGVLTLLNGFGSFSLQMPITIAQKTFRFEDYDLITLGDFLAKSMLFIPICIYLFIRLNIVLSLLLKNQWLVLMVGGIFLFSERFYYSRTTREVNGIEISNFPQTYFDFGKVIAGEKNYLVNLETITYTKGITVLLISVAVVEILLFLTSRFINKRRFYK